MQGVIAGKSRDTLGIDRKYRQQKYFQGHDDALVNTVTIEVFAASTMRPSLWLCLLLRNHGCKHNQSPTTAPLLFVWITQNRETTGSELPSAIRPGLSLIDCGVCVYRQRVSDTRHIRVRHRNDDDNGWLHAWQWHCWLRQSNLLPFVIH